MWLRDNEEHDTKKLDAQLEAVFGSAPRQEILAQLTDFFRAATVRTEEHIAKVRAGTLPPDFDYSANVGGEFRKVAFEQSVNLLSKVPSEAMPRLAAKMFYALHLGERYERNLTNSFRVALQKIDKTTQARRKGADVAHAENRAMKAAVFIWLDSNRQKYGSMDDTAVAITRQQPIKFRAARDWVGDWKKLRSASKP